MRVPLSAKENWAAASPGLAATPSRIGAGEPATARRFRSNGTAKTVPSCMYTRWPVSTYRAEISSLQYLLPLAGGDRINDEIGILVVAAVRGRREQHRLPSRQKLWPALGEFARSLIERRQRLWRSSRGGNFQQRRSQIRR